MRTPSSLALRTPSSLALRTPPSPLDISVADWREEEFTVLNLRIALRTNEPGLADHLRTIFPGQEGVVATVPPGRQDYVVSSVRNQAHQRAYQVISSGSVVLRTSDRDALLTYLERSICNAIAEHLGTRYVLIHAAALANEGCGFLFPGPSGAGKSLTAAALAVNGFQYFSDEVAVVTDDGRLRPFPKVISLKADGWRKLAEAFPFIAPAGCRLPSSESGLYHLNPSYRLKSGGRWTGPPVSFIILPSRRAGASTILEPLPKAATLTRLVEQSLNLRQLGTRAMGVLVRLVKESECFTLAAGSLREAGPLVARLAQPRGGPGLR